MELLNLAIHFATEAHASQVRKGSRTPYILHPLEVGAILSSMTDDEEIIAVGVLHDVLEDTDTEESELEAQFGERIHRLVAAESEDKQSDLDSKLSWKSRKQATLDMLAKSSDPAIKMIALADKLSNLRAMRNDFSKIGDRLWERFNQQDPLEHAWYYRSFLGLTSELSETLAWQEYGQLVDQVFGGYSDYYSSYPSPIV